MNYSPLQLIHYFVPEIYFLANKTYDPAKPVDGGIEQFSVETVANRQKEPENFKGHSWSLEMTLAQKIQEGLNFPYQFKLVLIGMFSWQDETVSGEREELFVEVNGSSILFGIARELVRSSTGLGPWDELFLPTISFHRKQTAVKENSSSIKSISP